MSGLNISSYLRLMRLDKPIGILVLLWPTLWALWIAAQGMPSIKILSIFIVGVIIMRSAGCIINDIADRNIDKHVKRTAHRPLTTGEVSVKSALLVFFLLILCAFILVLQLNSLTIKLSVVALLLACCYPFTKRWTYWPQLILGAAFAMSVLMAFAAVMKHLPLAAWLLYVVAVLWPLMYDTEYALVDREDDLRIGVKSTAILFGNNNLHVIGLLQAMIIILLAIIGILLKLQFIYFLSLILCASLFIYQLYLIRQGKREDAFKAFLNNQWVGLIVFLGVVLHYL